MNKNRLKALFILILPQFLISIDAFSMENPKKEESKKVKKIKTIDLKRELNTEEKWPRYDTGFYDKDEARYITRTIILQNKLKYPY